MLHEIPHILEHALLDSLPLIPFLFLTYLLMEFLEHKAGSRIERAIAKGGRVGPLWGAALGLIPQCGFSAAAAGFYAGRLVSAGTLLAVFLATSDEMLAVFLGKGVPPRVILTVLAVKFIVAVLAGFAADLLLRGKQQEPHVEELCKKEGCHCEKGIWRSALHHTLQVFLFVLLINIALTAVMETCGTALLQTWVKDVPVLGSCVAALIGLIPNCAASVAVATLYAEDVLSAGAMLAGLLTGAGAGLLVLFRTNRNKKSNLIFTAALLGIGILVGCLFDLTGLSGILGL